MIDSLSIAVNGFGRRILTSLSVEETLLLSTWACQIAEECYELYWIKPGRNTPRRNSCMATYPHLQKHESRTNKTCMTLLAKQGWSHKGNSPIHPYTWTGQCWSTSQDLPTIVLHRHRMQIRKPAESDGHLGQRQRQRVREMNSSKNLKVHHVLYVDLFFY